MFSPLPRRRKILYVASLEPFTTATYRLDSLKHLRQDVQAFDLQRYAQSTRIGQILQSRYPIGPFVASINRKLRQSVAAFRPDVVWFDKPVLFTQETMEAARDRRAQTVFYVQDAPFGPRNDRCWTQFHKIYRMADLHCLMREADVARYQAWGLPWIRTILSFDPRMHFPPASNFTDAERNRPLSYIGHPYEDRPAFLLRLARDHQLPVFINGNLWNDTFTKDERRFVTTGDHLAGEAYRAGIWKSKVNLSFVTEKNEEDIAHKAVEIAGCQGFLLALRTAGHQALFDEDREAAFFSSVEECADKARFYLSRPELREAIAARAHDRAVASGYDNDTQLARILNKLDGKQD